jgi:hypothetical protein
MRGSSRSAISVILAGAIDYAPARGAPPTSSHAIFEESPAAGRVCVCERAVSGAGVAELGPTLARPTPHAPIFP